MAEPPATREAPPPEPAPQLPTEEAPAPAPAAEPPAAEPPAEPAAPAKPDAEVDDLFKETQPAPAAPAPAPGEQPAAPAAPAEQPAAPAEQPPAEGEKPKDTVDDLFKETSEAKPAAGSEAAPASEPAAPSAEPAAPAAEPAPAPAADQPQEPSKEKVEDLFNEPAPKDDKSTQSVSPNAMRLWTDNTGKYHVNARLVMVSQTHVRLLKDTGKYTTVPVQRLSLADLAFVREHWAGVIAGR
jgi:hypothetical protein